MKSGQCSDPQGFSGRSCEDLMNRADDSRHRRSGGEAQSDGIMVPLCTHQTPSHSRSCTSTPWPHRSWVSLSAPCLPPIFLRASCIWGPGLSSYTGVSPSSHLPAWDFSASIPAHLLTKPEENRKSSWAWPLVPPFCFSQDCVWLGTKGLKDQMRHSCSYRTKCCAVWLV